MGLKSRTIEIAVQEMLQTYVHGGEEKQSKVSARLRTSLQPDHSSEWSRSYGRSCELVVEMERVQEVCRIQEISAHR